MTNFLIILVGLIGGYVLRKTGRVPGAASAGINAWILNLALPAVILKFVPQIHWSSEVAFPLLAPVVVLGGAWAFCGVIRRWFRWDRPTTTAIFLTSGLGNTSFVGFPLILAFYGPSALSTGVLCDQVTFVLLATVGVGTAAVASLAGNPGGLRWLPRSSGGS